MIKIQRLIRLLNGYQYASSVKIENWQAQRGVYQAPGKYEFSSEKEVVNVGDHLIVSGETMVLENTIQLPTEWEGESIGLIFRVGQPEIKTNHEALVRLDGIPYHGIDRNRSLVPLPNHRQGKTSYNVTIELYNPIAQVVDRLNYQNEPAEHSPAPLSLLQSELVVLNKAVENLLFTVRTYFEAARLLPDGDMRKITILQTLEELSDQVLNESKEMFLDERWVAEVEANLLKKFEGLDNQKKGLIHLVGQSHIDLAWLWPQKETVRKVSRTFSTMSTLLDQFPEFTYAQSQPIVYEFLKNYYPELYERVRKHIESGRWELVGGMWIEPDLNIPSGESLVRQLLYGMKYNEKEFGKRPRIEWLPDTFGYCASLPQLLRKAGIEYFMTTKMNWNDTNQFPYDLFQWIGIDGTSILSYLNHGVNEYTHPKELKDHWDSYKQKDVHPEQMLLYGHGDGGGGVTREMLKYAERSENLPGLPKTKFSTAHEFFDGIKEANPELPTWYGDMYLELHRGTYTTHARNKKWNRQAEVLYRDAEIWGSFAKWVNDEFPLQNLEDGWKLLLYNQFHDIIPGTSIPEVYVKSEEDYKEIFAIGTEAKKQALTAIEHQINTNGEGTPVVLFNSLSWSRSDIVTIEGGKELFTKVAVDEKGQVLESDVREVNGQVVMEVFVPDIPEMGYKTIWLQDAEQKEIESVPSFTGRWETDYYIVEWNENGEISRLFDKKQEREVIAEGQVGNQFQFFHDRPPLWDAWDIDPQFAKQPAGDVQLESVEVVQKGKTKDILRFQWTVSNSRIEQDVIFYHHSPRIDFATKIDWNEEHKLLKVAFPVDIISDKATYEIPFGTVERATHTNTSWEIAQFEVCGHRFADLSESNYGVSLLNDCKYGYDIKGNVMRLSLLRAPKWPDPTADIGFHEFTYSLYPHAGNWQAANVTKIGYELNHPVTVKITHSHDGTLPYKYSFVQTDATHVILDTIKLAEDENGFILRFYESSGGRELVQLQLAKDISQVEETNLLEEHVENIVVVNNKVVTHYKPYEVKTIRIQ